MTTRRRKLYELLEQHASSNLARTIHILLAILILVNVVAIVLASEKPVFARYKDFFVTLELVSVSIFTVEYLLRLWVAPEFPTSRFHQPVIGRIKYMLTPMAIIDLLAILPFYLGAFIGGDTMILRTLRLIRGFRMTRYSSSMDLLVTVLKQEANVIFSAFFVLGIVIVLAATGMYLVEGEAQPDVFGSIPRAIWWASVTLTTVGYGDSVPITTAGKFFGVIITIAGVGMAALPAGILASGFSAEINRRREQFKYATLDYFSDGRLELSEHRKLTELRHSLGISRKDAKLLIKETRDEIVPSLDQACPHCGKPLLNDSPSKKTSQDASED